jgi:hypothetical protein
LTGAVAAAGCEVLMPSRPSRALLSLALLPAPDVRRSMTAIAIPLPVLSPFPLSRPLLCRTGIPSRDAAHGLEQDAVESV